MIIPVYMLEKFQRQTGADHIFQIHCLKRSREKTKHQTKTSLGFIFLQEKKRNHTDYSICLKGKQALHLESVLRAARPITGSLLFLQGNYIHRGRTARTGRKLQKNHLQCKSQSISTWHDTSVFS